MSRTRALENYFRLELPSLKQFALLVVGIAIFGFGNGLFLSSGLGLSPWNVFHMGLSLQFGGTIGAWTVGVSMALLLLWIPLKEKIGVGTLVNSFLVGPMIDLTIFLIPETSHFGLGVFYILIGLVLCGFGSGLYITRNLGAGPRDGLMTALGRRGVPIWIARNSLEATALILGIILGGKAGLGTAVFVFGIGPSVQFFLKKFGGQY